MKVFVTPKQLSVLKEAASYKERGSPFFQATMRKVLYAQGLVTPTKLNITKPRWIVTAAGRRVLEQAELNAAALRIEGAST